MKKEQLQKKIDEIKWFHSIELPYEEGGSIVTPGLDENHCSEKSANERFGLPIDLTGKTVLDVGCFDGYFSFLAEKRGADVSAIDPLQGRGGICETIGSSIKTVMAGASGFFLSKKALGSNVKFAVTDLANFENPGPYSQRGIIKEKAFDIVLYYGVLYHVKNPLEELEYLSKATKEAAIIETAIAQTHYGGARVWEFNPGFDGDETNKWYPSLPGLVAALKHVGFKKVDLVGRTPGGERVTVKAFK